LFQEERLVDTRNLKAAEPGRLRWVLALAVGTALWLGATVASQFVPQVFLRLPLHGWVFALVGLIQALLAPAAIGLALLLVGKRLTELGLTSRRAAADTAIGVAVAVAFTALQFLWLLPATGGANRSDVATNLLQIGDSWWGVAGVVVLAWTGSFSEELFFRGLLLTGLVRVLGGGRAAAAGALLLVSLIFAALHGYQGMAGVVDTGMYGGLTMGLLFLWRRSLTACIVAHALWNSLAAVGLFLFY
jgi:membrane protease YdiL (CAAX protease family)